jgi:hypothetical protein
VFLIDCSIAVAPTLFWLTRCGTLDYLTDTLPEARVIDGAMLSVCNSLRKMVFYLFYCGVGDYVLDKSARGSKKPQVA